MPGDGLLLAQGDLIARALGVPRQVRSSSHRLNLAIYAVVMDEPDDTAAQRKIAQVLQDHRGALPDATLAAAEAQLARLTSPWFRSFLAHDPRPTLRGVELPVLAINGELDLQVPPRQNLPAIVAALEAGGNRDYAVAKLPRLNHLFQTAETGSPAEYEAITGRRRSRSSPIGSGGIWV